MIKVIDFDGYNRATIKHIYDDGQVVADLACVEVNEEVEVIIKQDSNIVFPADYFTFTQEELDELKPKVERSEIIE